MNLLSVDVDDLLTAYSESSGMALRRGYQPTIPNLLPPCLESLAARGVTATFFIQGWIARRWPSLVQSIVAGGHEIASHGMTHHRVDRMDRAAFASSAGESRRLLEDISGCAVVGYRSPSFSAVQIFDDAQRILLDAGYIYDSSAHFKRRQLAEHQRRVAPLWTRLSSGLLEFPLTTLFVWSRGVSIGSSFYTRRFPVRVQARLLKWAESMVGGIHVYFHPNELAGERVPRALLLRHPRLFVYLGNVQRGSRRLRRLLDSRTFGSIRTLLESGAIPQAIAQRVAAAPLLKKAER